MLSTTQRLRYFFFITITGFVFVSVFRDNKFNSVQEHLADIVTKEEWCHNTTGTPLMVGKLHPTRKYAVYSTTSAINAASLNFIFLLPLTTLAWRRIGFHSIVFVVGEVDIWNSDPLLYFVVVRLQELDAAVVFLDVRPTNAVMVSQVKNK